MSARPRLLVVTSTYPRFLEDNEPDFVAQLTRRLVGNFDVLVLAPHAPGLKETDTLDGIEVRRFRYAPQRFELLAYEGGIPAKLKRRPWLALLVPLFLIGQMVALVNLSRKFRPNLIHCHWVIPQGFSVALLSAMRILRAPFVVTAHGSDIGAFNHALVRLLKAWILRSAIFVTVVSNDLKTICQSQYKLPASSIEVLPMGVDLRNTFVPGQTSRRDGSLIFVGRLSPEKGVHCLLDALHTLVQSNSDICLVVVGDGPCRDELKQRVHTLGLKNCVKFLGALNHSKISALLQQSKIAIVPSEREGFGLVAVEAMGSGCALVVSRVPSLVEIVENGECGLVAEANDQASFASAILSLLKDDDLRDLLAQKGRASVISRYDWQEVGKRYGDLLLGFAENHLVQSSDHLG